MKKINFTCLIVLFLFRAGEASAQTLASRVLVVKNSNSPVSVAIADDYMKRRNVTNVVSIACRDDANDQDAESIDYPDYLSLIEVPIAAYLKIHPNIDFIVLTKGIPIRIYNAPGMPYGGRCSLDARISTLDYKNSKTSSIINVTDPNYGSDYVGNPWANKYWNSEARFTHQAFGGYLVTRLDGYTQADAIALTTRSLEAEKKWMSGNNTKPGPILLDACSDFGFPNLEGQPYTLIPANYMPGDTIYIKHESEYGEYNSDMSVANDYLLSKNIPVLYDTRPDFVGNQANLQGYISWGSNDTHYDADGYNTLTFAPGAIAETAVSTSARTFLPTSGGQSLIDDLVLQGVTGVKGYTDEPLLQGIASPSVMFNRYTRGWTLAESFYAASRLVGWQGMVIGDPICRAYAEPDQAPVLTASGGSTALTGLAEAVDKGIKVTDADNATLASGTVALTAGFHPEDVLSFKGSTATGNISGNFNATTGVLSLISTGATATVIQWQTALQTVTYQNTAANPNTAARTITFVVSDGVKSSIPVTKNITINVPVINTTGMLSAFSVTYGKASASVTFHVSGLNLTKGITVTAPAGFEVSKDNSTFTNSITVGLSGTIASTAVYIRLAADINAGNYAGNVVLSSVGAANVNVPAPVSTVNKATLTITANNVNKTYGQAITGNLTSTAFSSVGLIKGQTVGSVVIAYTAGAAANASVGSYTGSVVANTATGGTFNPVNYTITYEAGNIIVGKGILTIAANTQSKTYGSKNPVLTVSYNGFVSGDNSLSLTTQPSVTTPATVSSGAGTYPVTVSGAVASNYDIVYTAGTLTVNKAVLTITADNKTRIFGITNPTLTATYTGFVNGDTETSLTVPASISTVATVSSLPGVYTIKINDAVSSNYTLSYVAGKLTVIPLNIAGMVNLTISQGTLSPAFNMTTSTYTVQLENDVDHVRLIPTFVASATATVNGTPISNGSPSFNIPLTLGNNTISIVITAQDGVTSVTYTIIVYRGQSQETIMATNILTPNGDGKNDTWIIKDIKLFPNNTVTVFDKGGRTVYNRNGYNNDWNGTYGGSPLTEGTYYYVVDLGPKQRKFKGFITIIRNR